MKVIKLFYLKVGLLFWHVSVFSWLDHVWFGRFAKTGVVSETDKVMTKVIFQFYLQIDRGVRFKSEDPLDTNAKLTKLEKREWRELDGWRGCSIEDFNNTNRSPNSLFKNSSGSKLSTPLWTPFLPLWRTTFQIFMHILSENFLNTMWNLL